MEKKFTILDEGRSDTIDPLSPFEMSNILGGANGPCTNGYCTTGYCEKNYTQDNEGNISCGCGYIKPVDKPDPKPTDPTNPVGPGN